MDEPEIDPKQLEQEVYRKTALAHTAIYVGITLAELCREARGLLEDERERRRVAFNRPPCGLEGKS